MAIVTRSDFRDWKSNPVTRAFFDAAKQRIEEAKEVLSVSAGSDPLEDKILVGLIRAYYEMQDFRVDDLEDNEE